MAGSADRQGALWGRAHLDWAYIQEAFHVPLWDAMLDAMDVRRGSAFLDAGCGGGGAAVLAAGRNASVTGLDASAALVEVAQDRVPDGDFRVGDLEDLPFDRGAFDAVMAASSIQYAADPVAALRELARVTAPDGRVAVALLSTPDKVDYKAVTDAVRATIPAPPAGGGPFALSSPGVLEELVHTAGMAVTVVAEVNCPFVYPDMATYLRGSMSGGGVQAALEVVATDRIRTALQTAAEPFRHNDGTVRFDVSFRYLTATTT